MGVALTVVYLIRLRICVKQPLNLLLDVLDGL